MMKKVLFAGIALMMAVTVTAQKKAKPVVDVNSNITSNRTFYQDTIYVLHGLVRVNNATLTIQAGTVVKGGLAPDNSNATALIIDADGVLNAIGTATNPIIFTSGKAAGLREYGDWGGLVYFGKAPVNKVNPVYENGVVPGTYGGTDAGHNQGTLKYVRIEFAGYPFEANRELNSLTMCGVGNGTSISYVQCSYNNDDAYEWFGGTVNCNHLIAFRTNDDDFDVDFGYSGKVQFGVSVSDTSVADVSVKNGFEIDNDASGSTQTPLTSATFSNMTIIGAYYNKAFVDQTANHGRGAHIRRNSSVSIFNSVIAGWKVGARMDGSNTLRKYLTDSAYFQNNVLAGNLKDIDTAGGADPAQYSTYMVNPVNANRTLPLFADAKFGDAHNYDAPNWTPLAGSPLLTGASFSNSMLSGFTQTTYVGAFGQNDTWAQGWTEWDPVNASYDSMTVTAVTRVEPVMNLSVYPNPAASVMNLEFDILTDETITISLIDVTGKEIKTFVKNENLTAGAQNISMDLNGVNNGVYFVMVKSANGVKTVKTVVNR